MRVCSWPAQQHGLAARRAVIGGRLAYLRGRPENADSALFDDSATPLAKRKAAVRALIEQLVADFKIRGFKPERTDTFRRHLKAKKLLLDVHDGFLTEDPFGERIAISRDDW